MVGGKEQALLGQVRQQADHVVAAAADLHVLAFIQVIYANVGIGTTGQLASDFFAYKEVGMFSEFFTTCDRVVIGKCEQVHAALAQRGVNVSRSTVAFQKKMAQDGHRQGTRVKRMDVQVAFHREEIVAKELC